MGFKSNIVTNDKRRFTALVGTPGQVSAGEANFSDLQSAHDALSDGDSILLLPATIQSANPSGTANLSKKLYVEGSGSETLVDGDVNISSTEGYYSSFKFGGTIQISGDRNFVNGWSTSGNEPVNTGDDNAVVISRPV